MATNDTKGKVERAQTIFRVEKNKDNPFVMIDRRAIENPKLSWKAKGLLAYLLSRPDNWVVRFRDLGKRSPDGAHTVRVAMKELRTAGHVTVETERDGGRITKWIYHIHEVPDGGFQQVEKQDVEPPDVEELDVEKRAFNDTDSNETELNNKTDNTNISPSFKKGDLVDGWLQLSQSPGMKRQARIDAILSGIASYLKINTETKRWKDFAKFVDDRQQDGEKLDTFLSWVTSQKNFDIQFWPPSKMQELWPQAFNTIVPGGDADHNKYIGGEYADYIEH
jgi:hypothetical protein